MPPEALFFRRLAARLERDGAAALVTVAEVRGSVPREAGAAMAVTRDGAYFGTVGGGALEWEAQMLARRVLAEAEAAGARIARRIDRALGPDLGQCCGGRVLLDIVGLTRRDIPEIEARAAEAEAADARWPVALFGAGHVGRALALALAPLPFRLLWLDGRDGAFPDRMPAGIETSAPADLPAVVARLPAGAAVLVMTHDHALDLAVVAAALSRPDLPFVGLIGSATKRARFMRRLAELGIPPARAEALHCPVGLPGIEGKEPAVIAASVAAQLLEWRSAATAPAASRRTAADA